MCGELLRPNSCLIHFRGGSYCADYLQCAARMRVRILAENRDLIPHLDMCPTCGQTYEEANGYPAPVNAVPAMNIDDDIRGPNNNAMQDGHLGFEEEEEDLPPPRYHRRDPNNDPALRAQARQMNRNCAFETLGAFNMSRLIEPEDDALPPPSYDTVRFMDQYDRQVSSIQPRGNGMAHESLRRRNAVRATPEPNRFSTSGLQNSLMNGLARSNPFQGFAAGRLRAPLTRQRGHRNLRQADDWMD